MCSPYPFRAYLFGGTYTTITKTDKMMVLQIVALLCWPRPLFGIQKFCRRSKHSRFSGLIRSFLIKLIQSMTNFDKSHRIVNFHKTRGYVNPQISCSSYRSKNPRHIFLIRVRLSLGGPNTRALFVIALDEFGAVYGK